MKQEETERKIDTNYVGKYTNADHSTIQNIKVNYERMEKGIVNELYFKVPHGSTIGHHREQIWGRCFGTLYPESL